MKGMEKCNYIHLKKEKLKRKEIGLSKLWRETKPVSHTPLELLLQFLPAGSCTDFPWEWAVM